VLIIVEKSFYSTLKLNANKKIFYHVSKLFRKNLKGILISPQQ